MAGKVKSNSVETEDKECLINYLRSQNIHDDVFNTTLIKVNSDECKQKVKSEKDLQFIIAHQEYEENPNLREQLDCFMESIKDDDNFINLLLKKKAIRSIKLSWKQKLNPKNWFWSEKKKSFKAVQSEISAIEFENLFICEYKHKFELLFDYYVEQRKQDKQDRAEDDFGSDKLVGAAKSDILSRIQQFYSHYKKSQRKCIDSSMVEKDFVPILLRVKTSQTIRNDEDKKNSVQSFLSTFREIIKTCKK